jgi:hypothetical protein
MYYYNLQINWVFSHIGIDISLTCAFKIYLHIKLQKPNSHLSPSNSKMHIYMYESNAILYVFNPTRKRQKKNLQCFLKILPNPWGITCGRRVRLTNSPPSVSPLSRHCGIPNISQLYKPSARGYNWSTLFLGDVNTGTWPSRLGESQMTVKYGREFCGTSPQE